MLRPNFAWTGFKKATILLEPFIIRRQSGGSCHALAHPEKYWPKRFCSEIQWRVFLENNYRVVIFPAGLSSGHGIAERCERLPKD